MDNGSYKHFAPTALFWTPFVKPVVAVALVLASSCVIGRLLFAQARRRQPSSRPSIEQTAPRGTAAKYSTFLHSSDKHKSLACNACHKIPTAWTAKRAFPDVADFPTHDACVRCHRSQFFSRQSLIGTGPAICVVCHTRAAPRVDARFAFGAPNNSNQPTKSTAERQFTIEFPHDKHQSVIALLADDRGLKSAARASHHRLKSVPQSDEKPDYNNCSICHMTNVIKTTPEKSIDAFVPIAGTFKTMPKQHDACFNCHWKSVKPGREDCGGCHKSAAAASIPATWPTRISAKFAHEGGKGEHVIECTTCHINITRAASLRGLTPDVPVAACVTCHSDNKKVTYPKVVTIQEEFEQNQKSGQCTYCHTSDVGRKKPPPSHQAAVQ